MKSRLLVTGACGFLGQAVVAWFAKRGWEVNGIGHTAVHGEVSKYLSRWHASDINVNALATYGGEPDLVVHCAGSGSVPFSMMHPLQDYERTAACTAAVLEYVRLYSPATRIVFPSSAAVYGLVSELPIRECHPFAPASPYGAHKLIAEELCRSYSRTFGLSVAIIRFFSIYGEGLRKQLLWDACCKLQSGRSDFFGSGAELRDWIHVDDAARLAEIAHTHATPACPVVNGASGTGVSVQSVLGTLCAAYGTGLVPTFNGTPRPGDPQGYQASTEGAKAWGWNAEVDLQQGLTRYVDWFKAGAR